MSISSPVPAMEDSPAPEAAITPSTPQKLWTPLTISLTVLVVVIVLSIVFLIQSSTNL